MLTSTVVIALLAAQVAPSFAAPHSYVARGSAAGEVAEDAAKAAASSGIGKTIAGSLAGALTSLGVGTAITDLFPSKSSRRDLEFVERAGIAGLFDDEIASALKTGVIGGAVGGGATALIKGVQGLIDNKKRCVYLWPPTCSRLTFRCSSRSVQLS
ncbi:hypothetical protein BC834DRAFT_286504 [Gloeopeniophorella convolvens]|nr:hypothetical protein BC834DRAFT_286504 [Gloeopeniophorella convolvens]